jgi:hypothetical protein
MTGNFGRIAAAIGAAVLAVAAGILTLPSPSVALLAPEAELRASLLESGITFDPLSEGDRASVADRLVPATAAIKVVAAGFPVADPPVAYLGRLTVMGVHRGDESSPLEYERTVAYGIRLTGLSLPPFGNRRTTVDPAMFHTEMVVFVDARTGNVLFATDYR